jgi:hypothetical protein
MLPFALATLLLLAPQDSVTVAQVHEAYHDAFVVVIQPTPTDTLVGTLVRKTVPPDSPMAPLVASAPYLLTYLLQHGTGFRLGDLLAGPKTQARLQQSLDSALAQDARFNRLLLPVVAASLAEDGRTLVGQRVPAARIRFSLDSAATVAARFFYPDTFAIDGTVESRICTGRNGLPPVASDSELLLEAFVFGAMRTSLFDDSLSALPEYREVVQNTLEALSPSLSASERLGHLRAAAWSQLSQSSRVRDALRSRYVALAPLLPFRLE